MSRAAGHVRAVLGGKFPALEASSAVLRRIVELYREVHPVPGSVLDEATWSDCTRRARLEIEGKQP